MDWTMAATMAMAILASTKYQNCAAAHPAVHVEIMIGDGAAPVVENGLQIHDPNPSVLRAARFGVMATAAAPRSLRPAQGRARPFRGEIS